MALHDLCAKSTASDTAGEGAVSLSEMITIQVNDNGAKCVVERDELGQTALHLLVDEGSADCIKTVCELLKKEVVDSEGGGDNNNSNKSEIDRWISSIDLNDFDGITPLCAAIGAERDLSIIKLLVELGGAVVEKDFLNDCQENSVKEYLANFV